MVELGKCVLYIVFHGDIYTLFLLIPIQVHYAVCFAFPIDGYFVMIFDCIDDMEGVVFGKILDNKVVNEEQKGGIV